MALGIRNSSSGHNKVKCTAERLLFLYANNKLPFSEHGALCSQDGTIHVIDYQHILRKPMICRMRGEREGERDRERGRVGNEGKEETAQCGLSMLRGNRMLAVAAWGQGIEWSILAGWNAEQEHSTLLL